MKNKRHSHRKFPPFLAVTLTIIIATCPILWSNAETREDEVRAEETEVPEEEVSGSEESPACPEADLLEEAPALPDPGIPDGVPSQPDADTPADSSSDVPANSVPEETSAVLPSSLPGQESVFPDGTDSSSDFSENSPEGKDDLTEQLPSCSDPSVGPTTAGGTEQPTDTDAPDGNEEKPAHQHDASCGYRAPQPEIPCDHQCTDTDGDGLINHCAECAFHPADPGSPCRFEQQNDNSQNSDTNEPSTETVKPVKPQETLPEKEDSPSETESTESPAVSGNDAEETEESSAQTESSPEENASQEAPSDDPETGESDPKEAEKPSDDTEEENETETENPESLPENPMEDCESDLPTEEISGNSISGNTVTDPSCEAEISLSGNTVSGNDISSNDISEDTQIKNEPSFAIAIPARVILNETRSFPIQLLSDQPDRLGSVLVTVEGTTSPDGRFYALYCGQSWWSYQLLMDGNQLNPRQNQVMLTPQYGTRQVQIQPAGDKMYAGTYSGSLRFSVSYYTDPESSAE